MLVLAALDFSHATNSVLDAARNLAKRLGARAVLLHVEAPEPEFVGYSPGPQTVRDRVAQDIRSDHDRLRGAQHVFEDEGVETDTLLVQGPAVDTIIEEAKRVDADYIVLGSHGHGALYELVMGSVTDGVLRHAPCPVVVVSADRGDTAAEEA